MYNDVLRTRWPKSLVTATGITFNDAYDPVVYNSLYNMLGVNQLITVWFPDSSAVHIWGWLNKFEPPTHVEGTQPAAACEIIPSNLNDSEVETAPNYDAVYP
jgi:hypothetical protein